MHEISNRFLYLIKTQDPKTGSGYPAVDLSFLLRKRDLTSILSRYHVLHDFFATVQ